MLRHWVALAAFTSAAVAADSPLVDRVGATGFVQLEAESFHRLSPRQQALAYWLSEAAIAIDPIVYDQNSRFGLRQKRLMEALVSGGDGKIVSFAKLFWANRGNHNDTTAQKFLPEFTFEELKQAAARAFATGAFAGTPYGTPAIRSEADLTRELEELRASLFDPAFESMMTVKSPPAGMDILQASANNLYANVTLADLEGFREQHPLNSRLVKSGDGKLVEEVYRAGTPDGKIPPGRYAQFLRKAIAALGNGRAYAEPGQNAVIAKLIRYYQTGNPLDWAGFGIAWVQNSPAVDFANGFIEVYRDARGAKGTAESFVTITDAGLSDLMVKLAANAQYFEDRTPWAPQYKKQGVKPPVAKAVETVIETGDYRVTVVGVNLPNENEIREKYGTKSFLMTGSSRALRLATGDGPLEEFAASPAELAIVRKHGEEAERLHTAMHEVLGHGSGKLNPKLAGGAPPYLKEYYSTLEEARADLVGLWSVFDPKVLEMKLISSPDVAKAMYYNAARVMLTQLRRIPRGDTIEQDHQRNRQLIARYIQDKTGAIQQVERNGKTYIEVADFAKMRQGVGELLAELMRIKAEGDYNAIKALVDRYAVRFDPKLRDQVVERYRKLDIPTYWAGINPDLTATLSGGKVSAVRISYPRDYVKQQLRYASVWK
jgi:dipeptidyl-peptidase-3